MGVATVDRVVEKLISLLKTNFLVTHYCGSGSAARVYGSHLSTIQDWKLPAVTIHMMPGSGRQVSGAFLDQYVIQIEPWMYASGANANVLDDLMELHGAIQMTLHRAKGWDTSIGIKILDIRQLSKGPQIQDPDGIMHYPSRWRVVATV